MIYDVNPMLSSAELHGVNAAAVIEALLQRLDRRRAGDFSNDGRRIGLVIEGGAMRSVYSAGGALALAQMGFSNVFDEVYATSAGVMNASYFLSNQPMIGITVYYDSCTSALFMNPLRVWKVLDIDYLFDQVIAIDKPLDAQAVLCSPTRFFAAVIDRTSGTGKLIDTKKSDSPLLSILKAATAMPILYNRSVSVDGSPCMDGGLAIPFPLLEAIAHGCTDVLVLLTRPVNHHHAPPSRLNRVLFNLICARGNGRLNEIYAIHHHVANRARDIAFGRVRVHSEVNIATVCTEASDVVTRTTSSPDALHQAATAYAHRVLRAFSAPAADWRLPMPVARRRKDRLVSSP